MNIQIIPDLLSVVMWHVAISVVHNSYLQPISVECVRQCLNRIKINCHLDCNAIM